MPSNFIIRNTTNQTAVDQTIRTIGLPQSPVITVLTPPDSQYIQNQKNNSEIAVGNPEQNLGH